MPFNDDFRYKKLNDSLGNILYYCTLLYIIGEHLHDLYTLNSLFRLKRFS